MCRKMCLSKRYLWPTKPFQSEDMLKFESNQGLIWGKSNLIDFWLLGITSIKTKGTNDGKVG